MGYKSDLKDWKQRSILSFKEKYEYGHKTFCG